MAVEPEKQEDGLDKDGGEAHDSFNDVSCSKFPYHSLTQTIFNSMWDI